MDGNSSPRDAKPQTRNNFGRKATQSSQAESHNTNTSTRSPGSILSVETRNEMLRSGSEGDFSTRSLNGTANRKSRPSPAIMKPNQPVHSKPLSSQSSVASSHIKSAPKPGAIPVRSLISDQYSVNSTKSVVPTTNVNFVVAEDKRPVTPSGVSGKLSSGTKFNGYAGSAGGQENFRPDPAPDVIQNKPTVTAQTKPAVARKQPPTTGLVTISDESEWSNSEEETTDPKSRAKKLALSQSARTEKDSHSASILQQMHKAQKKSQLKSGDRLLHNQLSSSLKAQEIKTPKHLGSTKFLSAPSSLVSKEHSRNVDNSSLTPLTRKIGLYMGKSTKPVPVSDTAIRTRVLLNQKKLEHNTPSRANAALPPNTATIQESRGTSSPTLAVKPQQPFAVDSKELSRPKPKLDFTKNLKRLRQVMVISAAEYEENLRSHISQMRSNQSYFTKHKIRSARATLSQGNTKSVLAKSPFEGLTSVHSGTITKQSIGKFGHFVKGTNEKSNILVAYQITPYEQETPSIPPYAAYIPAKRNILTEDDRQRTFLPYHGDDFEVDDADKEYAALETKIEENQTRYHRMNRFNDLTRIYTRYTESFLSDIGCTAEAVLRYLLDESEGPAPSKLPAQYTSYWKLRTSYLQDGYYEEEDDQDALERQDTPDQTKPCKQWQQLYEQLTTVSDEQLAIACLACKVFQDIAEFSLFHVVQSHIPEAETSFHPYSLGTYVELACFLCKAHECPGHGEYHDYDQGRNTRERVNFKPGLPNLESLTYRTNNEAVVDLLGLQDDGEVAGLPWTTFRESTSSGFSDQELCHDDCFWAKQARISELSVWHKDDNEAFRMLRSAYEFERRGPCLIAQCGLIKKSCKEIFLKLLIEPTTPTEYSLKIFNEFESATTVMPPRRTIDQWFDDPKSDFAWRQDQREPFVPCDHSGPCSESTDCSCFQAGVHCEKSCACSEKCTRRFQGCRCHAKGKPCKTDKCECRRFNRECDPDICTSCEADEVLDPVNRHNEEAIAGKCTNVSIQRGVPKRTLLGPSKLMADGGKSGWGLYMGEECKKGDFIGEYRGEIISEAEADQRGTIYDKRNLSYLFGLNGAQLLDSTLIGNKLRFINHQAEPWASCFAKLLLCNGVVRIGMFAQKDIAIGEEMFFNYGENFATKFDLIKMNADGSVTVEQPQKGSKPKEVFKRRLPHARNSHYQLKNKISKNGQRLGRPPKGAEKGQPSSLVSGTSRSTTSRKRLRSEISDDDEDYCAAGSGAESDSEAEKAGGRASRRKRLRNSPPPAHNEPSQENIKTRKPPKLRETSARGSQLSETPTQSPGRSREDSHQAEYGITTRTKAKSQSQQSQQNQQNQQQEHQTATSPLGRKKTHASPLQDKHVSDNDSDEEVEEEELTPRRSSRRRFGKHHFDDPAGSPTPPSSSMKRTARKQNAR